MRLFKNIPPWVITETPMCSSIRAVSSEKFCSIIVSHIYIQFYPCEVYEIVEAQDVTDLVLA
jgi:hypothetical protein